MTPPIELLQAVPVLLTLDSSLDETVRFYTEKLGFALAFRYAQYAAFERQQIMLHVAYGGAAFTRESAGSCYIYVRGLDALYAEYQAQGVVHPNGRLEAKSWGVKEFVALDNNNNALRFGEVVN